MRKAFVMGSNGPKNLSPLQYALEDARRIKACFESPRCGFEVTLIEAETDPLEIRRRLYYLVESCTPQDTFIFYFAGHGIAPTGSLFLFLDETDPDRLGSTSIPISEVLQSFQFCQAHSKLLVLDCCHAGAAINTAGLRSSAQELVKEIVRPDNQLVLMASDSFEKARELDALKGGFLTANICAALGEKFHEADKTGDGRLSIQELMEWLKERAISHNTQCPDKKVPYPYKFGQERGDFFLTVDESVWIPHEIIWHDGSTMVVLPIYPQDGKVLCLGKHPVTNEQYRKCVKDRFRNEPVGKNFSIIEDRGEWVGPFHPWQTESFSDPAQPVVCVSYADAEAYCRWLNSSTYHSHAVGRTEIPSINIWDFAALGTEFRTNNPNTWLTQSMIIYHNSLSPSLIDTTGERWNSRGISDMFGNVWEWCSEYTYSQEPSRITDYEVSAPNLRGGSFLDDLSKIDPFLSSHRLADKQDTKHTDLGFRIAGSVSIKTLHTDLQQRLLLCKKIPRLTNVKIEASIVSGDQFSMNISSFFG